MVSFFLKKLGTIIFDPHLLFLVAVQYYRRLKFRTYTRGHDLDILPADMSSLTLKFELRRLADFVEH